MAQRYAAAADTFARTYLVRSLYPTENVDAILEKAQR
jgi:hypothetical protein